MQFDGKSRDVRVRIIATQGWLAKYNGQECDATLYDGGPNPHINTEQLTPPIPRWQTAAPEEIEVISTGW